MTSTVRVKDIMDLVTTKAAIVREDAPLNDVLREMVKDPKTQSVYVVDKDGRLSGIITLNIALQYLYSDHIPPRYLEFNVSVIEGSKVVARDIMLPPVYVRSEEPASEAFVKMFENHLQEIPVVDENMKIIGDVHGLELIARKLKS